jgi:hypothetical protein
MLREYGDDPVRPSLGVSVPGKTGNGTWNYHLVANQSKAPPALTVLGREKTEQLHSISNLEIGWKECSLSQLPIT